MRRLQQQIAERAGRDAKQLSAERMRGVNHETMLLAHGLLQPMSLITISDRSHALSARAVIA
jgi:hypothetical protein